jgi:dUTP pyrophosphatase
MVSIELRVRRLHPDALLPQRSSESATGLDLYACLEEPAVVTDTPRMIPCGVALEFPYGFDVQVRPRSGLSLKGVAVALGTIDADYRGELLVTMWTVGPREPYEVRHGDRIAQLVVAPLATAAVVEVAELSSTARGDGGHGSTGR